MEKFQPAFDNLKGSSPIIIVDKKKLWQNTTAFFVPRKKSKVESYENLRLYDYIDFYGDTIFNKDFKRLHSILF